MLWLVVCLHYTSVCLHYTHVQLRDRMTFVFVNELFPHSQIEVWYHAYSTKTAMETLSEILRHTHTDWSVKL